MSFTSAHVLVTGKQRNGERIAGGRHLLDYGPLGIGNAGIEGSASDNVDENRLKCELSGDDSLNSVCIFRSYVRDCSRRFVAKDRHDKIFLIKGLRITRTLLLGTLHKSEGSRFSHWPVAKVRPLPARLTRDGLRASRNSVEIYKECQLTKPIPEKMLRKATMKLGTEGSEVGVCQTFLTPALANKLSVKRPNWLRLCQAEILPI